MSRHIWPVIDALATVASAALSTIGIGVIVWVLFAWVSS